MNNLLEDQDRLVESSGPGEGVEHVSVVVLGKRLDLVVPAAAHDLVVELVARGGPLGGVGGAAVLLGELDRPVERYPALEPAVGEVLLAAAGLPDSLVGLVLRWMMP